MDRIKITMLGISGAGKTSFFSGLYHALITSTLITENRTKINLIGVEDDGKLNRLSGLSTAQIMEQYKIENIMGNKEGTWDTDNFNFNIEILDKEMNTWNLPIYIFDYRGGLLQSIENEENRNEAEIVMTQLISSHVLLIMADAIQMVNSSNNEIRCKEVTGADKINPVVSALISQMKKKSVTVLVLLTKCDSEKIAPEYKEDGYKKLCQLARSVFDTVFSYEEMLSNQREWKFGILPITAVGEGNATTRYNEISGNYICELKENANPHQKNIDIALMYSAYQALKQIAKENEKKIFENDEFILEAKKIGFDYKARRAAAVECQRERVALLKDRELYNKIITIIEQAYEKSFLKEIYMETI